MQAQLSGRSWTIMKGSEVQTHMGEIYKDPPQSRGEAILRATIDGTDYNDPPQSRVEDLLIELKEAIEAGGGGGGAVIDDNTPSTHKVYSSEKVEELIDDKKSVESIDINAENNHLVVTYDDGSTHDAGEIPGGDITSDYPDYAKTEMESVASAIDGYIGTLDNPIIIGFNTDQHLIVNPSTTQQRNITNEVSYGLRTLRDLTKRLPFNFVVLGGDTHGNSGGLIQNMQDSAIYVYNQMDGADCPVAFLVGNHEGGQDNSDITRGQVYKSHMTKALANKVITSVDYTSGYYDDSVLKVRYIFLDSYARAGIYTTYNVNTVLNTMLSSIPAGYKAIIFSHHPLDENLPQAADRKGWNNPVACHATLQTHKDKIIACFCGHIHNNLYVENLDGITFIATTCAGWYELNDGSTRTAGVATATAYDVFVIDQVNETIHAIRYGNGEDRTISYAHSEPTPTPTILLNVEDALSVEPRATTSSTVSVSGNDVTCSVLKGGGGFKITSAWDPSIHTFEANDTIVLKCDSGECDLSGGNLPGYVEISFLDSSDTVIHTWATTDPNVVDVVAAMASGGHTKSVNSANASYWNQSAKIQFIMRASTNSGTAIDPPATLSLTNFRIELA